MKAKNIGLLATLALVTTVGGVYAAFQYNNGYASPADEISKIGTIESATLNQSKGTLSSKFSDDARIYVFEDEAASKNNTAKVEIKGSIIVTFTVDNDAEQKVKDGGLEALTVTTKVSGGKLGEDDFFVVQNTLDITDVAAGEKKLTGTGDIFEYTIPLSSIISFNSTDINGDDLVLEDYSDYQAWQACVTGTSFAFVVSEKTVA